MPRPYSRSDVSWRGAACVALLNTYLLKANNYPQLGGEEDEGRNERLRPSPRDASSRADHRTYDQGSRPYAPLSPLRPVIQCRAVRTIGPLAPALTRVACPCGMRRPGRLRDFYCSSPPPFVPQVHPPQLFHCPCRKLVHTSYLSSRLFPFLSASSQMVGIC